jgi:hypothetical protein
MASEPLGAVKHFVGQHATFSAQVRGAPWLHAFERQATEDLVRAASIMCKR